MHAPSLIGSIASVLSDAGVDLAALGLAWARVAPTIVLVPAFGLRVLPAPVRGALGLALALCIFPALTVVAHAVHPDVPWPLLAIVEVARGIPIALAAAVPLWAATMAGGVADSLRGAQESVSFVTIEGNTTSLGVPIALLASALFLAGGGPSRVLMALATRGVPEHPLLTASHDLVAGIGLAVALGGPLLAAAVVLEIAAALVARAASPAQIHALIAPLRALGLLGVFALVFERLTALLAHAVRFQ